MSKILIDRAVVEQALDFCEFAWRDVLMNEYAFKRLEQMIATLRASLAEQPAEQDSPWCMKMNDCKTKCEDCPDEVPQPAEQESGNWIVYNSGAEVESGLSLAEALEYLLKEEDDQIAMLTTQRDELLEACIQTVEENGHLADGENCTLIHLVRAIAKVEGGAA